MVKPTRTQPRHKRNRRFGVVLFRPVLRFVVNVVFQVTVYLRQQRPKRQRRGNAVVRPLLRPLLLLFAQVVRNLVALAMVQWQRLHTVKHAVVPKVKQRAVRQLVRTPVSLVARQRPTRTPLPQPKPANHLPLKPAKVQGNDPNQNVPNVVGTKVKRRAAPLLNARVPHEAVPKPVVVPLLPRPLRLMPPHPLVNRVWRRRPQLRVVRIVLRLLLLLPFQPPFFFPLRKVHTRKHPPPKLKQPRNPKSDGTHRTSPRHIFPAYHYLYAANSFTPLHFLIRFSPYLTPSDFALATSPLSSNGLSHNFAVSNSGNVLEIPSDFRFSLCRRRALVLSDFGNILRS